MDWASQHAKFRGAHFWKAFTTGKSQALGITTAIISLGGIPHDLFGMTTRSTHAFVVGIYKKLGVKVWHMLPINNYIQEEECRKLQTGGPDGDLGSNEIKISSDRTIGTHQHFIIK